MFNPIITDDMLPKRGWVYDLLMARVNRDQRISIRIRQYPDFSQPTLHGYYSPDGLRGFRT